MMARWSLRLVGGVVAAVVVAQIVDGFGARFLRRQNERRVALVAIEASKNQQYRRPIIFGPAADQNAAVWYRRTVQRQAFAQDVQRDLVAQVEAGFERFSPADAARLAVYCREAHDRRLQEAFRSVHCDWETGFTLLDEKVFESVLPVIAIASCLALEGHDRAHARDWRASSDAYLKAIAFASDLGRGDELASTAGLGVARIGITALSRLLGSIDDTALLGTIGERLSSVAPSFPSFGNALRYERLQLTSTLLRDAQQSSEAHNLVLRMVVPWRALAAIGLARDLALVDQLKFDSEASTDEVDAVINRIRSSGSELLKLGVDTMSRESRASDEIWQSFRALRSDVSDRERSMRH